MINTIIVNYKYLRETFGKMTVPVETQPQIAKRRTFGGKIDNFQNNEERAFQKKHLKAYLRGDKLFQWGWHPYISKGKREPKMFHVIERWL